MVIHMTKIDELIKKVEELFSNAISEIDRIHREAFELVSKGRYREALKLWKSRMDGLIINISRSIDAFKLDVKDRSYSDDDITRFREYIVGKLREFTEKYEQSLRELERSLGKTAISEEARVPIIDLSKIPGNIISSITDALKFVERSIGEIATNISRIAESLMYDLSSVVSSVRLRGEDLRIIDQLVKAGIFRSRSEAISYFTRKGIEASREWIDNALNHARKIRELQEAIRRDLQNL